jgi:predicted TIM-barrel fold metal-dependent hydrolase
MIPGRRTRRDHDGSELEHQTEGVAMSEQSQSDGSAQEYRGPIYDAHAHLVSDDLERYPRTHPFREGSTESSVFGPGTVGKPGGMHGPNPVNEKPTAEKMHGWMAEDNVVGIAAVQKGMIYGTDNSYIVDAADIFPDEMRAIIIVDPQAPETPQMVRDYARRGIIGIRFFGVGVKDKSVWLSSPAALEVWALAADLGLLVDIEAPAAGSDVLIPVVESMADRFPNLRIVLDHVFLPTVTDPDFGITAKFDGFASRDNIFYKFTSLNMDVIREKGVAPEAVLRRVVDFYGPDKVMWGSDIGTSSGVYKEMIQRAKASTSLLNDEERRKVLHDNGRRIFLNWDGASG